MSKNQTLGRNSASVLVRLAATPDRVPVPSGVALRSAEEQLLWGQITKARPHDSWREFDLVMVAKIVGLVADIRRIAAEIDRIDPLPTGELDMAELKPWIEVQGILTRRLLALTRCLGLTQLGHFTGKGIGLPIPLISRQDSHAT